MKRSVLISGCGIAGPTLAYFLAEAGFAPTIVERSGALRSSGSPVDIEGDAVGVVEKMGTYAALAERATRTHDARFIDEAGRTHAAIPIHGNTRDLEVPRSSLAAVLHDACQARCEILMGESVKALTEDAEGVNVTFEHAPARRFDLVVGADGVHSNIRRIAFGPEREFMRHRGMYVATARLDVPVDPPDSVLIFNAPGRSAALHPCRGEPRVLFIFRSKELPDLRDRAAQSRLLSETYAKDGWRVPELLERLLACDDLYFDSVSEVRLASWRRGRVTLLGDAASCLSLLGNGSSNAILSADTLARALTTEPTLEAALVRYEKEHRRRVASRRAGFQIAAAFIVPRTAFGISLRNALMPLFRLAS